MSRRVSSFAIFAAVSLALGASSSFALAQGGKAGAAKPTPASTPAGDAKGAAPKDAPAAGDASEKSDKESEKSDTKPAAPARNVAGYGYRDPPKKGRKGATDGAESRDGAARLARVRVPAGGPIATLPGFEMLADGGSRCFVQLSKSVEVEERKSPGSVSYLLKGARIALRNNQNALETVHFNTPVTRARLIGTPAGLQFTLDLRGEATPKYKLVPAKDGSAILQVEFPAGKYLPTADAPPAKASKVDGHR